MRRVAVIHQPDFLPYLGFFHRLLHADVFVILDHVQFVSSSRGWTHRDKIKTPRGAQWVTIAVEKGPRDTPINEMRLSKEVDWRQGNMNLLAENYRQAPFYREVIPHIESLYASKDERLVDFCLRSIGLLMELFGIQIETALSSSLSAAGSKNELLVDILKKMGATTYLSGVGARAYLNPDLFAKSGIEVLWQQFQHPIYPQLHGEFMPNLSSIDLLFNCGVEESRRILRSIP